MHNNHVEHDAGRRRFLKGSAGAAAAVPVLGGPLAGLPLASPLEATGGASAAGGAVSDPVLVVIEARGGWDYLSMLPPVDSWEYQVSRPHLKLSRWNTLELESGSSTRWHRELKSFKDLYDRGDLAIIQNVGSPNGDLSHFVSETRLRAADPWANSVRTGWLANYLTKAYTGGYPVPAIDVGYQQSESFEGAPVPIIANPDSLKLDFDFGTPHDSGIEKILLEVNAMMGTMRPASLVKECADRSLRAIREGQAFEYVGRNYTPQRTYPLGELSERLKVVARYVTSGLQTRVYHVSTTGFDTHAQQATLSKPHEGELARQLKNFSDTVKAFLEDVDSHGHGQRVVVMMVSEFGRRVTENGSIGTDHGHGGVAFLAGKPVNRGRYGQEPDLRSIHRQNQSYFIPWDGRSTDFRSIYATVLEKWLGVQHQLVLGQRFPMLGAL